ncbi:hypothetical protein CBR_g45351 [Chara braunii]|uniref:Uncharacterized protein n=1 Tax=Chara braunii TaxID=69332 RepID=A0A388LYI0_CHABU|nr:hypothetical protein CBR_g45351 [Chara braunii]|eukprot:GBG87292.1 hypothetical protein CBR_g45351 [Chara braunii]
MVDKKCRPVPVLVTEDEEAYYERERGLIRRMRESALAGPCRINEGNEGRLITGEPDFLLPQKRTLMVELMKRRHRANAFSDDERGRLDVDKIPMIRIHTVPHEPWNMRGARYPNPDVEKKVVDYLDGKIRTHVADYSSGPYASPWFFFIKPNGTLRSDFTKTAMPRGGRGTRPPRRPLGASGGYEQHGPHYRQSTLVYDDGDIELFLDGFWDHARHMGWTVAQAIERLRGAGRFEEPVAWIHREGTTRSEVEWRMQELRPSPVGPDGRPIRLEIGNVSDFIPAFEWLMAHLRETFRRPEPPPPRVERHQRSQRQRDPEPKEVRPSRGGRKALSRREEEPEPDAEERDAYPECGLGPVEFHRFAEGELRRSPARKGEEHGEQAEEEPREEVLQKEVQDTQRERGLGDEERRAGKEVIEVGEDTPPQTPAVGLRLGDAQWNTHQAGERLLREETPLPSSEKAPSQEGRAERRRERAAVRREALTLIDRHLAAHALDHPDLEEPTRAEPRSESCQPEKEMEAEIPKRVDLRTRERAPAGETAEEKGARRTRRINEIWQERQSLEATGELSEQHEERQRSEAA